MRRRGQARWIVLGGLLGLGAALAGARPAGAQTTPTVQLFVGRASGSGQFAVAPGRFGSFNFHMDTLTVNRPVLGQLLFLDPATGARVVSEAVTGLFIGPGEIRAEGVCTVNGLPGTFQMEAFEAARAGQADNFFICYQTPFDGSCVGGLVAAGAITIRLQRVFPPPAP